MSRYIRLKTRKLARNQRFMWAMVHVVVARAYNRIDKKAQRQGIKSGDWMGEPLNTRSTRWVAIHNKPTPTGNEITIGVHGGLTVPKNVGLARFGEYGNNASIVTWRELWLLRKRLAWELSERLDAHIKARIASNVEQQ